jgi:peptide deformylase
MYHMSKHYLRRLDAKMGRPEYNMNRAIPAKEIGMENPCHHMSYDAWRKWLAGEIAQDEYATFIMYLDDYPIGHITVVFDEKTDGGNLSYVIRPVCRGKGLAAVMLDLVIPEAKKLGVKELTGFANKTNHASRRTMEKCGFVFVRETEWGSRYYRRDTSSKRRPRILKLVPEHDPILRKKCRTITKDEILSAEIQNLIDDIKHTCDKRKTGVGLSANQVGKSLAISVVAIKPTPGRPNLDVFNKVLINTEIIEAFSEKEPMWEGCQSTARDKNGEPSMAKVPRFTKVRIKYLDRNGDEHDEIVEGFVAHVVQHETDHLNGVLITDLIDEGDLVSYREFAEKGSR